MSGGGGHGGSPPAACASCLQLARNSGACAASSPLRGRQPYLLGQKAHLRNQLLRERRSPHGLTVPFRLQVAVVQQAQQRHVDRVARPPVRRGLQRASHPPADRSGPHPEQHLFRDGVVRHRSLPPYHAEGCPRPFTDALERGSPSPVVPVVEAGKEACERRFGTGGDLRTQPFPVDFAAPALEDPARPHDLLNDAVPRSLGTRKPTVHALARLLPLGRRGDAARAQHLPRGLDARDLSPGVLRRSVWADGHE